MANPKLEDMTREQLISLCREQRRLLAQGHERFKRCNMCSHMKPVHQFSRQSSSSDGLQGKCKECASKAAKKWRDKNPDYFLERIAAQS